MKKIFLTILFVLVIAACGAGGTDTGNPTTPSGTGNNSGDSASPGEESQSQSEEDLCADAGGDWIEFPHECAATCGYLQADHGVNCPRIITESCDCGDGFCWDGENCIEL